MIMLIPKCMLRDLFPTIEAQIKFMKKVFEAARASNYKSERLFGALDVLFTHRQFCENFIKRGYFERQFRKFQADKKLPKFVQFLPKFESDIFLEEFAKIENPGDYVIHLLELISGCEVDSESHFSLIYFVFTLLSRLNRKVIESMSEKGSFRAVNTFLLKLESQKVIDLYSTIISRQGDEVDHVLLKELAQVFRSTECTAKNKRTILLWLCGSEKMSNKEFIANFILSDWFCDELLEDEGLWAIFCSLTLLCSRLCQGIVSQVMSRIIDKMVPPFKSGICYQAILLWMAEMARQEVVTPKDFNDDYLIEKLIVEPDIAEVHHLIDNCPAYGKLLEVLLSNKRTKWHSEEFMERVTLLWKERREKQAMNRSTLSSFLMNNYTPGMLLFFMKNLHRNDVADLFEDTFNAERYNFQAMATDCDLLFQIENQLDRIDEFAGPLLRFASEAQKLSCDRFFDQWVVSLPKESKIFSLSPKIIDLYMFYDDGQIALPSLMPVYGRYITEDPYNLYLLGRYAVPVFLKLEQSPEDFPCLEAVLNQFVTTGDLNEIIDKHLKTFIPPVSRERGSGMYEFFKSPDKVGWATLREETDKIKFAIKFPAKAKRSFDILSVCDQQLDFFGQKIYVNDTEIAEIELGSWQVISIREENKKCILSINSKHCYTFNSSLSIQYIGNKATPASVTYFIKREIKTKAGIAMLNVQGSAIYVPYHSVNTAYRNHDNVMMLFERLEKEEDSVIQDLLVVYLWQVFRMAVLQPSHFMARYMYALKQRPSIVKSRWLSTAFFALLNEMSRKTRTRCFMSLFMDIQAMCSFPPGAVAEFLKVLATTFAHNEDLVKFDVLFSKGILHFVLLLMLYFENTPYVYACLREFLGSLATKMNKREMWEPLVENLSGMNMVKLDSPNRITENSIRELSGSYLQESKIQAIFTQFIMEGEKAGRIVLSPPLVLYLSYVLPVENGVTCFIRILDNMINEERFFTSHIAVIARISVRYSFSKEVWKKLRSFRERKHKNMLLPIVLEMILGFCGASTTEQSDFAASIATNVIKEMACEVAVFLKPHAFPHLMNVTALGNRDMGDIELDMSGIVKLSKTDNELQDIVPVFATTTDDFKRTFSANLKNFAYGIPSRGFLEAFGRLIHTSLAIEKQSMSDIKEFMETLAETGTSNVTIYLFSTLCLRIADRLLSEDIIDAMFDSIAIAAAHRPEILKDIRLLKSVTEVCSRYPQSVSRFLDLFINFYDDFSNEALTYMITVMANNNSFNLRKHHQSLFVLYKILVNKLDPHIPEISRVFTNLAGHLVTCMNCKDRELTMAIHGKSYTTVFSMDLDNLLAPIESELAQWRSARRNVRNIIDRKTDLIETMNFVYTFVPVGMVKCVMTTCRLHKVMNDIIRGTERRTGTWLVLRNRHQSWISTTDPVSYRFSPFTLPGRCPAILVPSHINVNADNPDPDITGIMNKQTGHVITDLLGVSTQQKGEVLDNHFRNTYAGCEDFTNCYLIRYNMRIQCVLVAKRNPVVIIMGASFNKILELEEINKSYRQQLSESLISGEFGEYTVFCRTPVIEISMEDVIFAKPYCYAGNANCMYIFTIHRGGFILEFLDTPPIKPTAVWPMLSMPIDKAQERWIHGEISNLEYLMAVNFNADRLFEDLTAYPIVPRVMNSFEEKTLNMNPETLRDLSVRLEVQSDEDGEHMKLRKYYPDYQCHHRESLTPMHVSTVLSRVAPFCQITGSERTFTSIPNLISLNSQNYFELLPEFFSFPEVFTNINKLTTTDGSSFEAKLPAWATDAFRFIEKHRMVLESNEIREKLSDWINLFFGYKSRCEEALEMLNSLNRHECMEDHSPKELHNQKLCIPERGSVPVRIFTDAHPASPARVIDPFASAVLIQERLDRCATLHGGSKISYNAGREIVRIMRDGAPQQCQIVHSDLRTACHLDASKSGLFVVITFSVSKANVYMAIPDEKYTERMSFIRGIIITGARFSVISESQLLIVTACDKQVVFWSFSSGIVTKKLPISNATAMAIDEDTNTLFITAGKKIYHYTLSGFLIRELEIDEITSALTIVSHGFTIYDKVAVVGTRQGSVFYCAISEMNDFRVIKQEKLSRSPITRLIFRGGRVEAYDTTVRC